MIVILERNFGQFWWLHMKGENSPYNGAWRALLGLAGPSKGGLGTVSIENGVMMLDNDGSLATHLKRKPK